MSLRFFSWLLAVQQTLSQQPYFTQSIYYTLAANPVSIDFSLAQAVAVFPIYTNGT